jgi:hypothetical protein
MKIKKQMSPFDVLEQEKVRAIANYQKLLSSTVMNEQLFNSA